MTSSASAKVVAESRSEEALQSSRAPELRHTSARARAYGRTAQTTHAMERYDKGRTLGEGTFGVVYEARVKEVRESERALC